ncbi:hypothetical protein BJV82DRAFT_592896 [Fennellomyces sp. T-0311]|nr:hypothetical protein BJV82DRAFT_592896 [Fennellomyces sp. T-0311]
MYGDYSRKDWRRSDPNVRPSSVAMSYSQSPTTKTTSDDQFKLSRRPVPVGKSVAALQQQHQWLMQKSNDGLSPSGSIRSNHSSIHSNSSSGQSTASSGRTSPLIIQRFAHGSDDGEEEVEERSMISAPPRAEQSLASPGASTKSPQAPPRRKLSTSGQEFKVAREGWIYRRNGLMQWKQVYAVAKHGNAIKPGGLYLYKDDKFSSHIQTFDMSEVVEVEPRAQEYRPGIKWELRILVKREDVYLATDDIATRKAWIDALTSIMGKVSMATHSELQSRVMSADQANRELQSTVDSLQTDNQQLREQVNALQKVTHQLQDQHDVREKELAGDLDDMQQAMETRCELLEGELSVWRAKANGLEKELSQTRKAHEEEISNRQKAHEEEIKQYKKTYDDAMAQHKMEVAEWRARVEVHEKHGERAYYHQAKRSTRDRRRRRRREDDTSSSEDDDHELSIKETIADVRLNLQALREQIKSESGPLVQNHIIDIKAGVKKLDDTLDEARKGWTDLQIDIMRFFEEGNNKDGSVEKLNEQIQELRQELNGEHDGEKDEGDKPDKNITFASKFDVMMQMVEMVQLSQNRLMACYLEQAEDESKGVHIDKVRMEAVQLMLEELQEKLSKNGSANNNSSNIDEFRDAIAKQLEVLTTGQRDQSTELLAKLDEYMASHHKSVLEAMQKSTDEIQTRGREDHDKNLQVLGQLLQHVISQIEASSIPDLPSLSEQLEQTVERLNTVADRLPTQKVSQSQTDGTGQEAVGLRNVHSTTIEEQQRTLEEIHNLIGSTQSFIERTLRVLDRYDNTGVEEAVRRAVKNAFHWEQQNRTDDKDEKLIKRYEENARGHFDKSMSGMRKHLEEYTGEMYRMIEDLVLRAVEHLEQGGKYNDDTPENGDNRGEAMARKTDYLIELHTKLSSAKEKLEDEIERLQEEKQGLDSDVSGLKKTRTELEKELQEKRMALHATKVEHETLLQNNATTALARELEPLVHQIARLKQLASFHAEDDTSSGGYVDLGHLSQQQPHHTNPPSPPNNEYRNTGAVLHAPRQFNERRSSFDSSSSVGTGWKTSSSSSAALNGARPRAASPLGAFLGRKS